jgi:hypothetical protein
VQVQTLKKDRHHHQTQLSSINKISNDYRGSNKILLENHKGLQYSIATIRVNTKMGDFSA